MPDRQAHRSNAASPPQALLPMPVFALPVDASEDQSGLAKIQKWLELGDAALMTPHARKTT